MRPFGVHETENGVVHLIGVVRGLVSEGVLVEKLLRKRRPAKIALGISPEELVALRTMELAPAEDAPMTRYEENYARGLGRFGEVAFPAPCFAAAVAVADELGIEVVPLDMPEEAFSDMHVDKISSLEVVYHTLRLPVLDRIRPKGKTAAEFVTWWDGAVDGYMGFAKVQREREAYMARSVRSISGEALAFVEFERAGKVMDLLRDGMPSEEMEAPQAD